MAKTLNDMEKLLVHELSDLHSAETQILEALPKMVEAASSPRVKKALQSHVKETQKQKDRLEKVFGMLGKQPSGEKCKGMEGLLREGREVMRANGDPNVKDAAIVAAAQRVEHYEIAGYGTARTHADMLGHKQVARQLQTTLNEEGRTDHKLTDLAQKTINVQAIQSSQGGQWQPSSQGRSGRTRANSSRTAREPAASRRGSSAGGSQGNP